MSNHSIPLHALGKRLYETIVRAGGIRPVARAIGLSEASLNRYFIGKPIPSDKLVTLARYCNVRVAWLVGEEQLNK